MHEVNTMNDPLHRLSDATSTYSASYRPTVPGGWITLAVQEPNLIGALKIVADRLGLDAFSLWAPSDGREWKQADTFSRLELIRDWIAADICDLMDASLDTLEITNIGGTND
jgi:hypothetical protein